MRVALACALTALVCVPAACAAGKTAQQSLTVRSQYDAWYAAHGQDYVSVTDAGVLGWQEGKVIRSLLEMYEATGLRSYLEKAARHVAGVMSSARRDASLGWYGWETTGVSASGRAYPYAADDGEILYAVAKFVHDARSVPGLRSKADAYIAKLKAFAAQWNFAWHEKSDGEGFYVVPRWPGLPVVEVFSSPSFASGTSLPLNESETFGMFLAELYTDTHDAAYLKKARAIARTLKDQLTLDSSGGYLWEYAPRLYDADPVTRSTKIEDCVHGAVDVEFAMRFANLGVVFTRTDVSRFVNSFLHIYSRKGLAELLTGGSELWAKPRYDGWVTLGRASPRVQSDLLYLLGHASTHDESAAYGNGLALLALNAARRRQ